MYIYFYLASAYVSPLIHLLFYDLSTFLFTAFLFYDLSCTLRSDRLVFITGRHNSSFACILPYLYILSKLFVIIIDYHKSILYAIKSSLLFYKRVLNKRKFQRDDRRRPSERRCIVLTTTVADRRPSRQGGKFILRGVISTCVMRCAFSLGGENS